MCPCPCSRTGHQLFPLSQNCACEIFPLGRQDYSKIAWPNPKTSKEFLEVMNIPLLPHYVLLFAYPLYQYLSQLIGESGESFCWYVSVFPLPCIGSSKGCSDSNDLSTYDKLVCKRGLVGYWRLQFVEERTTPEAWKFSSREPLLSLLVSRFHKRRF